MHLLFQRLTFKLLVIITSFVLLGLGGFGWYTLRQQQRELEAQLPVQARLLLNVLSTSLNDEIGDLIRSFNQMSAELATRDLTSIIGFAQLAKRKFPENSTDGVVKYVDGVAKEAKRCADIIENLAKFARRDKPQFSLTNVNRIVKAERSSSTARLASSRPSPFNYRVSKRSRLPYKPLSKRA